MTKDMPCVQCGSPFAPPYAWSKLCSPECAAARRVQMEAARTRRRLTDPAERVRYRARQEKYQAKHLQPRRRCESCGAPTAKARKRCEECRRPLPVLATRRPRVAASPEPPRVFIAGTCPECAQPFVGHGLRHRYCSAGCSRRAQRKREDRHDQRSRRRARKKGAFVARVNRFKVYERDAWRCQLCRQPVDRSAQVPHPLAPVLDHIIPLARGGTHEPANVQCAHFLCNSKKGANAMDEQLRLIG